MQKHIFILLSFVVLFFTACDKVEDVPTTVNIAITSPIENQEFNLGDTIKVFATVTSNKNGCSSFVRVFFVFKKPNATIPASCVPSYNPSMAASFIGCLSATWWADSSPLNIKNSDVINPKVAAMIIDLLANKTSLFLSKYQALTPITNNDAKT